ncbi:MAG: MmgE/PrpD family protein [Candidatus Aminicenantes bacterium]|nr:MAG: MmgE/PrpD family protein [Candidatus Aminicenantes bacterium]
MFRKMRFLGFWLAVFLVFAPPGESKEIVKNKKTAPKPVEVLAAYVNSARFNDFPKDVVNRAKYLILDNIGCALGGTQTDLGRKYLRVAANWKGIPESTIMGIGTRVSCMNAAYVNTQLANVLDFDDTYDLYSPGHPGNAIIQTAISLGEAVDASGEELLTAVILGYEVCLRIGQAEGPIDWQWPIYVDSMTRGTTAVSSRLLKLEREEICTAFHHAIELLFPPKREKFDIPASMVVPETKSNFGLYAMQGILAARLAQQGVTGWDSLLEGDLKKWFLAGGEVEAYDILTGGLGKIYRIMEVSFKPTPSCRLTHAPITALWKALDHKPVKAKDIEQIVIKGVKRLDRPQWEIMMEAQFSMQCVIALAALGIEPGPKWYTTGKFKDPEVRELAAKVKLENDPEAEELELRGGKVKCTAAVKYKDGTVKKATIHHVKGAPGNPMTQEELKAKFKANTIDLFSEPQVARIIDAVLNLEKLPRVSDLTKLLISPKVTIEKGKK